MLSWLAAWHGGGWVGRAHPDGISPSEQVNPSALASCCPHTEIWMLLYLVTFSPPASCSARSAQGLSVLSRRE